MADTTHDLAAALEAASALCSNTTLPRTLPEAQAFDEAGAVIVRLHHVAEAFAAIADGQPLARKDLLSECRELQIAVVQLTSAVHKAALRAATAQPQEVTDDAPQ